jgi:hypothetical protein
MLLSGMKIEVALETRVGSCRPFDCNSESQSPILIPISGVCNRGQIVEEFTVILAALSFKCSYDVITNSRYCDVRRSGRTIVDNLSEATYGR